jgi:excisionase family DNA binding protein
MSDLESLYTAGKAAKYLGVSRQRIYELAQAGRMGKRIGGDDGVWVFSKAELDAYKEERDAKIDVLIPTPVIRAAA